MRVLFLFLDGVGLGEPDAYVNPWCAASLPTLRSLLGGRIPSLEHPYVVTSDAVLYPTDATGGVTGLPQSATGQASLLTGVNVPALVGEHYGPRPDRRIRPLLERDTFLLSALKAGKRVAFANAYPPRFFQQVDSGRRLPGALPYAARSAGIRLRTAADLAAGRAFSVDYTNQVWREQLGFPHMPVWTPREAGRRFAMWAQAYDLVVVDQWATDMAGHRRDWEMAVTLLERFDAFLNGIVETIDLASTVVLVTSDHGNLEDMRTRRHTRNPVFTLIIGPWRVLGNGRVEHLYQVRTVVERALAIERTD